MCFNFTHHCNSATKTILFAYVMIFSYPVVCQESSALSKIEIKPGKCVSMRQQQTCYISPQITWQAPQKDEYCLYSSQQSKALQCWSDDNQGTFTQAFAMDQDISFTLRTKLNDKPISSAVLRLAWVHKREKLSHSSWRVF